MQMRMGPKITFEAAPGQVAVLQTENSKFVEQKRQPKK
jgi:hypothetical protein